MQIREASFRSGKLLYRARILRSGSLLTQANKKAVSLSHQIQVHPRSKPSREPLRSWRPTPYRDRYVFSDSLTILQRDQEKGYQGRKVQTFFEVLQ